MSAAKIKCKVLWNAAVFVVVATTGAFGRDLVVPQPVLFRTDDPQVHDLANIGLYGVISDAGVSQGDFLFDPFTRSGSDEVIRYGVPIPPYSIAQTTFGGTWNNLLWPFAIQQIPFGIETDTFYTIDNSRIDPQSIFFRVVSQRGSTVGLDTFNDVHLRLFHTSRPVIEVLTDQEFHTAESPPRFVKDITASELWPELVNGGPIIENTEIGRLRFRGQTRSNPISWTSLDVGFSPMVKNPLIQTVVPLSQQGSSNRSGWPSTPDDNWGALPYASQAYDIYLNSLPEGVFKQEVADAKDKYNIYVKGCTITAWSMALTAAGFDSVTPRTLQGKIESLTNSEGKPRNLLRIEEVTGFRSDGVPNVDGANITPYVVQQAYPDLKVRRLFSNLHFAESQIVAALARGEPTVLRLGYDPNDRNHHSVLVYGASAADDGRILLDIVDTWPRDGQSRIRPNSGGGLPGDRSRDSTISFGGTPLSLEELENTFGVTTQASYVLSRYGISDGFLSINSSLEATLTTPDGTRIRVDTFNGLLEGDEQLVSVNKFAPDFSPDFAPSTEEWQEILARHSPSLVSIDGSLMNLPGEYRLELTGVEDDDYWVDMWWDGWEGMAIPLHVEGFLRQGETHVFTHVVQVPEPTAMLLLATSCTVIVTHRRLRR